jgi:ABC-2 type transport system ATP-binding protein
MPPAISIQNLVKDYKQKHKPPFRAVDHLNLNIDEGDFFGLLGPNGAGKSTTINAIIGLCKITSGSIGIFGFDTVKDYQITRRMIGIAPQEYNYDPFLKIHEILSYQARYYGIPAKKARVRAFDLLEKFGLKDKAYLEDKMLSGGMKRRLNVARALMHEPKILILDEPTAGLDFELRVTLWEELKALNEAGTTIILTTHYLEEAEKLCKNIGIINCGKMLKVGSKANVMGDQSLEAIFTQLMADSKKSHED